MKAKIITKLTHARAKVGDHFEPHGTLQHVAHFPHPGAVCQLKLGPAGLQYQRGEHLAVVPLADIIALFEAAHPEFAEPPNKPPSIPAPRTLRPKPKK